MAGDTSGLRLAGDMYEAFAAAGALTQITAEFRSGYYVKSIMDYAHTIAAGEFDLFAFSIAKANTAKFHHVFEPNHVGERGMQLWSHKLTRSSSTSANREITWTWRQSRMPIRTPKQRRANPYGNDPITEVPKKNIGKLSNRHYIFRNRAPMMEYGMPATVLPRHAKALFIPKFGAKSTRGGKRKGFFFAKYSIQDFSNSNPQYGYDDSQGTVGNFTQLWTTFWNGAGERSIKDSIERAIRDDVANSDILVKAKRKRAGGISLTVAARDSGDAFIVGRELAKAHFKGKSASYKSASKYAARTSWGDIPFNEGAIGYAE